MPVPLPLQLVPTAPAPGFTCPRTTSTVGEVKGLRTRKTRLLGPSVIHSSPEESTARPVRELQETCTLLPSTGRGEVMVSTGEASGLPVGRGRVKRSTREG